MTRKTIQPQCNVCHKNKKNCNLIWKFSFNTDVLQAIHSTAFSLFFPAVTNNLWVKQNGVTNMSCVFLYFCLYIDDIRRAEVLHYRTAYYIYDCKFQSRARNNDMFPVY